MIIKSESHNDKKIKQVDDRRKAIKTRDEKKELISKHEKEDNKKCPNDTDSEGEFNLVQFKRTYPESEDPMPRPTHATDSCLPLVNQSR